MWSTSKAETPVESATALLQWSHNEKINWLLAGEFREEGGVVEFFFCVLMFQKVGLKLVLRTSGVFLKYLWPFVEILSRVFKQILVWKTPQVDGGRIEDIS